MTQTVPNHHAGHRGLSGPAGWIAALTMAMLGRPAARLVADVTGVTGADHVVDVGCGPGSAAREAARRGARVTGVDPSPMVLGLAHRLTRRAGTISWIEGAAESLPLPAGSATVVWSLASVHHWPDIEAGLREAHRVLAPGGRLLVMERQVSAGATGLASHGWTGAQADAFTAACRAAGFEDLRVEARSAGRRTVLVVTAHPGT